MLWLVWRWLWKSPPHAFPAYISRFPLFPFLVGVRSDHLGIRSHFGIRSNHFGLHRYRLILRPIFVVDRFNAHIHSFPYHWVHQVMSTRCYQAATVQLFNHTEDWHLTTGCIKGYHTCARLYFTALDLTPYYRPYQRLLHLRTKSSDLCVKFVYLRVKTTYLRVAMAKDYLGIQRLKKDGLNWYQYWI